MQRSITPTEYLLIKADTNGEFNLCDFAIIRITKEWKENMQARKVMAAGFKNVPNFSRMTFYESPEAFYECAEDFSLDEILNKNEDCTYITLEENELDNLTECDNHLNGFLLHIDSSGFAFYSAYAEYTGEEYYTNDFVINQFIQQ